MIGSNRINVVIPLAGKDKRFEEKGIFKAFIDIDGKPLIKYCTDNLPFPFLLKEIRIFFIVLKEHELKYNVKKRLKNLYSESEIIILDEMTEGSACSILKIKKEIDNKIPLIVYLADTHFKDDGIVKKEIELNQDCFGFVPTFKSNLNKFSYIYVDKDNNFLSVAEKIVISDNASAGLYYFKHGKDFVWAAEEMIKDDSKRAGLGEKKWFFICPVYNELIKIGKKCRIIPVELVCDLGNEDFINEYVKFS